MSSLSALYQPGLPTRGLMPLERYEQQRLAEKRRRELDYNSRFMNPGTPEYASQARADLATPETAAMSGVPILSEAGESVLMGQAAQEGRWGDVVLGGLGMATPFVSGPLIKRGIGMLADRVGPVGDVPADPNAMLSPLLRQAPGDGQLSVFAGPGAATADLDQYAAAGSMAKAGSSPDEILEQTGWWADTPQGPSPPGRGARFEIPDPITLTLNKQALPPAPGIWGKAGHRQGKLSQALDHPELFEAYPDLADARLTVRPRRPGEEGLRGLISVGKSGEPRVTVIDDGIRSNEDMTSTLLHEIQHLIQEREKGFSRGGTAQSAPDRLAAFEGQVLSGKDAMRQLSQMGRTVQMTQYAEALERAKRIQPESYSDLVRLYSDLPDIKDRAHRAVMDTLGPPPKNHDQNWLRRARATYEDAARGYVQQQAPSQAQLIEQMADQSVKGAIKPLSMQLAEARARLDELRPAASAYAKQAEALRHLQRLSQGGKYRALGGEAEARAVQNRWMGDMMTPPWDSYDVPLTHIIP